MSFGPIYMLVPACTELACQIVTETNMQRVGSEASSRLMIQPRAEWAALEADTKRSEDVSRWTRFQSVVHERWMLEISSLVGSIVMLVGLAVLLSKYDEKVARTYTSLGESSVLTKARLSRIGHWTGRQGRFSHSSSRRL